jgi:hypothetical protein
VRTTRNSALTIGLLAAGALLGACREDLESGAACPALCPDQNVRVVDTTLAAGISLDTNVSGFTEFGTEPLLILASRGDTLETRVVVRFDSLPERFKASSSDTGTVITAVDSSRMMLNVDTAHSIRPASPITIEAYDVDSAGADTATAALAALFRPDRLIGTRSFAPTEILDTISVPLVNDSVADKFAKRQHLRVGLRVIGTAPVQLRLASVERGSSVGPVLHLDASPDSGVGALAVTPLSLTPADDSTLAARLADYTVTLASLGVASPEGLAVGGLPARRVYLRFDIPASVLDSATVVRATLLLTQQPNPAAPLRDSFVVYPQVVTAGVAITDVSRAAQLLGPFPGSVTAGGSRDPLSMDSLTIAPGDSGTRTVEMVGVLQQWRVRTDSLAPRAIVLRAAPAFEALVPNQAIFFSTEGPPELRPQLRISYVPHVPIGLP